MEEWRDIEGYEGLYEVSSEGRIKSLERYIERNDGIIHHLKEHILKPVKRYDGYLIVNLHNKGTMKWFSVHRLVANAFIENPDNLPIINHKNQDRSCNTTSNLEWCDSKYNNNYGTRNDILSKSLRNNPLKSKKVYQYDLEGKLVKVYPSTKECERNGYICSNVSRCCRGEQKTHKGYIWSYEPL